MDEWGIGSYEDTAAELAPVAGVAIQALGLAGDERLLDVACGTGNAALEANQAGARVTGFDASPRLLGVAREKVPTARFVQGDAARLPFEDGRFDAAVSVFGLIFARPAAMVAGEIARVVRPGGRVVVTAWPPRGPMFVAASLLHQALARSRGTDEVAPPVDWGDPSNLQALLGPYGDVAVTECRLAHRRTTPEAFWGRWERLHPIWIRARRELEPTGEWETLRKAAIAALREGAIGEGAPSPYLLAVLRRH